MPKRAGVRLITGIKELDAKLQHMKIGAANKVARPALRAGARVGQKAIKARIPPNEKYLKPLVGIAVNSKGGKQRAKVGLGVGSTAKKVAKRTGRNKGGVGIGGPNVHWAILGTKERKQKKSGKSTGAMPPQAPGLVQGAITAAKTQMTSEMVAEGRKRLAMLAAGK